MPPLLFRHHLLRGQPVEQAQAPAEQVAGVSLPGLLEQQRLGRPGFAAAVLDRLHAAHDDAGVLRRELTALEGGGGGRQGGQPPGQVDLGVGGAGADLQVVAEPGGAGERHCDLAVGGLLGGLVEGADCAGDGGVDLVAAGEGDLEDVGQALDVEALRGGPAERANYLL